ncbi:MAG: CUB domain-containing protein [Bacteroidota bacterium]
MIRIFTRFSLLLLTLLFFGIGVTYAQNSYTMTADTSVTTCDALLSDHTGADYYDDFTDVITVLRPAQAGKLIQITWNRFSTELNYDFVYVYDGPNATYPLLGKFHGANLPPTLTATNVDGVLTIVFHTDLSVVRTGFEVHVGCVDYAINDFSPHSGVVDDIITIYGAHLTSATGVYFYDGVQALDVAFFEDHITVRVPAGTQTGQLTVVFPDESLVTRRKFYLGRQYVMGNATDINTCSGLVLSHDQDANATYTNNLDYGILINPGTPGKKVRITFNEFDTENNFDYVYVYDGPVRDPQTLLGTFAGTALPPTITASNPAGQLYIFFHTDVSVVRTGFNFSVDCGTIGISGFTPHSGINPDIVTITGSGLDSVSRVRFNTSLPVTNFLSKTNTQIRLQVPPTATTGKLRVVATSGGLVVDSVNTSAIFHVGREYYMPTGTITTCEGTLFDHDPNDGINYRNGTTSVQTIMPGSAGSMVQLVWNIFRVEPGADYVYVYDGPNTGVTQVPGSPFTGTTLPGTVTATNASGALTVKFVTNGFGIDAGFSATIRCSDFGVTDFTPKHGQTNDRVTVNGTNLNNVQQIWFNHTLCPSFAHNGTSEITVDVPFGATSGPLRFKSSLPDTFVTEKIFQVGDFDILTDGALTTCASTLLSHEGGGNYPLNYSATETFTPATPGKTLMVVFDTLRIAAGDSIKVYDGDFGAPLLGSWSGNTSDPDTLIATNAEGKLTIRLVSDASASNIGFIVRLSCTEFRAPVISSIYPTTLRAGFPFVVYTKYAGGSSTLAIDGINVPGTRVGNMIKGNLPTRSTTGLFELTNRVGSSTSSVEVLDGNYCVPVHAACYNGTGEIISRVKISGTGLDNETGCNDNLLNNVVSFPAHGNKTAMLYSGVQYVIGVTTQNNHIVSGWIDYDTNGTFEASEWFNIAEETGGAGSQFTAENLLVVPAGSPAVKTVMRIRTRSATFDNGPGNSCTTFASGETEDYTVYINMDSITAVNGKIGSSLALYPNPNTGSFNLDLTRISGKAQMRIMDALGRTVELRELTADKVGTMAAFTVPNLSTGVYSLEVSSSTGRNIQRLVIQK